MGWLFNIKVSSSLLHEYLNRDAHVAAVRSVYAIGELHAQTNFTHWKSYGIRSLSTTVVDIYAICRNYLTFCKECIADQ